MKRLTREQQQRHNRVLLLKAAERIFASRGIAGASLDDVALEAGLTKGAVYSNFRNKGELILEVIRYRQTSSSEAQEFHQALDEQDSSYESLAAWCDVWIKTTKSGERAGYARMLFDFMPYALRDDDLRRKFLEFITPTEDDEASSPIPASSAFASLPVQDQYRILLALDLGLSLLAEFDPENVRPELYKTAVLALARTEYREPATGE